VAVLLRVIGTDACIGVGFELSEPFDALHPSLWSVSAATRISRRCEGPALTKLCCVPGTSSFEVVGCDLGLWFRDGR
jgi:hypothetical protein